MSTKEYEAEDDLLGSILRNDDQEEVFSNNNSPLCKQGFKSDSIIENVSTSEKHYFDSFNRSFEQMSLGSDQAYSPMSNKAVYSQYPQNNYKFSRQDDRQSVSISFDGHSFSTQESSINYRKNGNEHFGYLNKHHNRQVDYQVPYSPGVLRPNGIYQPGFNYQQPLNGLGFTGYQQERQPLHDINDDIQLTNDLDNMCGNQMLSRKVQKIIEHGRPDQRELIFNKLERSCVQFSKDVFGNYVMQKIFEKGTPIQQLRLFNKIRPHAYELSKNNFGCRVIQKIIEIISNNENLQDQFIDSIRLQVKSLLYDSSGNYVILKCLEVLKKEKIEFFLQPIEDSTLFLCSSQYGCKILLKALELFSPIQTDKIMTTCLQHQQNLCQQEFGNHILQFAIKNTHYQPFVVNFVLQHFEILCMNKYASNTVEKVVEASTNEVKQRIISILISFSQINGLVTFVNLSINPFGNYVIKKMIIMSNQNILQPLIDILRQDQYLITAIRSSEFGQRIYQLIEKTLLMYKS
ncbi:unnamed protein product [Paramecium primaurelia]|uniref:PUM-HD domain-containing protein n=1 Tax=Paramecium primaurelia TaxID=5886 RepID=A0A8S1MNG5_PARPR|nr:unnamed protein product [Paramecium primaurelia]